MGRRLQSSRSSIGLGSPTEQAGGSLLEIKDLDTTLGKEKQKSAKKIGPSKKRMRLDGSHGHSQ